MKKYYIYFFILSAFLLPGCQTAGNNFFINPIMSDATITTEVNNAFAGHPLLAGVPVNIQTQQKRVILSGYVKTIRQSDVAAEVASKIPGVKIVENNLIVRK